MGKRRKLTPDSHDYDSSQPKTASFPGLVYFQKLKGIQLEFDRDAYKHVVMTDDLFYAIMSEWIERGSIHVFYEAGEPIINCDLINTMSDSTRLKFYNKGKDKGLFTKEGNRIKFNNIIESDRVTIELLKSIERIEKL